MSHATPQASGPKDLKEIYHPTIPAVVRWAIKEGLLHQFLLTKEYTEWAENEKDNEKKSTTEGKAECKVERKSNKSEGVVENG